MIVFFVRIFRSVVDKRIEDRLQWVDRGVHFVVLQGSIVSVSNWIEKRVQCSAKEEGSVSLETKRLSKTLSALAIQLAYVEAAFIEAEKSRGTRWKEENHLDEQPDRYNLLWATVQILT